MRSHDPRTDPLRARWLATAVLLAALGSPTWAQPSSTTAAEIAPAGRLRVGFQVASPILAQRAADGSVGGVVVDLGRLIAGRLGAAFEPVVYGDQAAYAGSFGKGEWDIAIGVASAQAREAADAGPDFMLADGLYIAAPGRGFDDATRVDRPGVKVGVSAGGGADQRLSSALKSAQVVRVPGGVPNAVAALRDGSVDVWAANPVTLRAIADALPGATVVPGAWTVGRYAAMLPKGRSAAAQARLAQIVDEAKRSGAVQAAIDRAGFEGVRVAP
jgi:polar amino acid transport system substrate-binding protein